MGWAEQIDFPSKYKGVTTPSGRTGIGSAPTTLPQVVNVAQGNFSRSRSKKSLWGRVAEAAEASKVGEGEIGRWITVHGHAIFIKHVKGGKAVKAAPPKHEPAKTSAHATLPPHAPKSAPAPEPTPEPKAAIHEKPKAKLDPSSPEAKAKLKTLVKSIKGKPIKRIAAGGLVIKSTDAPSVEDMEILVAEQHQKWGGGWVVPKGGQDEGESNHQTSAREVEEETGVKGEVLPQHAPHVEKETFGDAATYDLPLIVRTLKQAHPEEGDFIDSMKDDLKNQSFSFENNAHFYLLKHVSGEPITTPDEHEEMNAAKWVKVKDARKLSHKVKSVVDGLMPQLKAQWAGAHQSAAT